MTSIHSIVIFILLWIAWCFLHSYLISRNVTARMKKYLGHKFEYYRLAYNIFSIVSLVPVIYFHFTLDERVLFTWPWPWALCKYSMYMAAFLLFYGGFRVYDLQYMLGISQVRTLKNGSEPPGAEFTTRGILGYVRHPWYSGAILLVWAFGDITDVTLVSKIILTVYVIIGTFLEEKKLLLEFGEPYRTYQTQVPMYLPWKRK